MSGILIAGIGNLFLGDDAFGVEVAQRMRERPLRKGVRVEDFGIRGIDLTYALLDDVTLAILVDATQRGGPPGSIYLIQPSLDGTFALPPENEADAMSSPPLLFSPHEMQPDQVLRAVNLLGGTCRRIVLIGCEPESFGTENDQEGRIGLSDRVAASVESAIALIESLIDEAVGAAEAENAATVRSPVS